MNGVYWDKFKKRWTVQISVNGAKKTIGTFKDLETAKSARIEAQTTWPEHARLMRGFRTPTRYESKEERRVASREISRQYYWANRDQILLRKKGKKGCQSDNERAHRMRKVNNPIGYYLSGIKARAKRYGVKFDLNKSSIKIPDCCDCCGKPMILFHGSGKAVPDSVSIDRLDSRLGYTERNIRFICWECNRLKSDCNDPGQFFKIWMYMLKNRVGYEPLVHGLGVRED